MSALCGFLLGTLSGVAGGYLANKYTDKRREKEAAYSEKNRFLAIKDHMPKLIAEIQRDFSDEAAANVREFFVLRNKKEIIGIITKRRFAYYENQHKNLLGQLDILQNEGYVVDVTEKNVPIYRMSEEFVQLLINH